MAKGKVLETIINIGGEISPTLGKTLDGVASKLDGVAGKAALTGAAIGAIGVGTVVAVGKAIVELGKLGDEYNSAMNDMAATTGLAGDELAGMGDVMKDVYKNNFGENMEDVANGVSEVYRQTGLVDEQLAETTKSAYALKDTFGYEVTESARAAKAMMTNFGVSGEEAMNMIAAGAQNGLDFSGEMIDSINEYSVQFAKLGFSADDMFNIFQQGADSGAWNLDKVGDAIKEFSIRSIDGSKTTVHAFTELGLNADEMMATFAAGGDDASVAFQGVITALMDMEDEVQRDALGVELFGTQWEDLGVEAMQAMADMQDGAYTTKDAIGGIMDVKYNNIGDAFEAVKRQAEVSLLPMATTVANAFVKIAPMIGKLFEDLAPIIDQTMTLAMPFVEEFLGGAMSFLEELLPMISSLGEALIPLLFDLVGQLLPPLLDLARALIPPFIEILQTILPPIVGILGALMPILIQIVQMILPVAVQLINTLLPAIMPVIDALLMLLQTVILPLLEPILMLVQSLLPLIEPLLTVIVAALSPVLALLEPLAAVLATIVGWIAKVVGWVAEGLNWVIKLIFGDEASEVADAAKVNGYATGGLTNGLSIAGEDPRYPHEWVISLNPAYREENLSYWAQAGRMLGADVSDFTLGGGSNDSYVDIGGITFAPNITVTGSADKDDIMEAIEESYPEFIDMLEEWFAKRGVPVYG